MIDRAQAPGQRVAFELSRLYAEFTRLVPQPSPLNDLLVDHFNPRAKEDFEAELAAFLAEKAFLADRIIERAPSNLLYRQPAVLLVYWAIKQAPSTAGDNSPLTNDELAPMYGDLGLSSPQARM